MSEDGTGPGRSHRKGVSVLEMAQLFPDDLSAQIWFEERRWPNHRFCPNCRSANTYGTKHKTMPYRCRSCQGFFSVKKGTVMEKSRLGYQKWIYAIYFFVTNVKGVSSMKIHRDLNITQSSAWYMMQRIRYSVQEALPPELFQGPVEVDESYFGGKEKNKHWDKKLRAGRGGVGKTIVAGIKDRDTGLINAEVVDTIKRPILHGFVEENAEPGAKIYTDDLKSYNGLPNHETVAHSKLQFADGSVHVNNMEAFWSLVKRSYHGTYHAISTKHLQKYIDEFCVRANIRDWDTMAQMHFIAECMFSQQITYKQLTAGGKAKGKKFPKLVNIIKAGAHGHRRSPEGSPIEPVPGLFFFLPKRRKDRGIQLKTFLEGLVVGYVPFRRHLTVPIQSII